MGDQEGVPGIQTRLFVRAWRGHSGTLRSNSHSSSPRTRSTRGNGSTLVAKLKVPCHTVAYRIVVITTKRRITMSWTVDPMHTQVEFSAKHMGIMTVKGAFTGLTTEINFNDDDFTASSVETTIDARTLSTHDQQRDGHLKSPDFLDIEHFPTIIFKSTRI